MDTIKLGHKPQKLEVELVQNADFVSGITRTNGSDWPVGLEVRIVFNDKAGTTFDGAVTGPSIEWNVDKAVVNTLIAKRPTWAWLYYKDGSLDLTWAHGSPSIVRSQ